MSAKKPSGAVIVGSLLAAVAVGVAVWYCMSGEESSSDRSKNSFGVTVHKTAKSEKKAKPPKKRPHRTKAALSGAARVRPNLKLDAEDESKLTEQMRAIYRELQEALDKGDRKRVFALVHKLQSMDEWPDGIPTSVKKRALDALAWFGAPGLAEAIGFLADSNPEIRSAATETFEQQLQDSWDLGDAKLGETLVAMAKVVTDTDSLDTFYEHLDDMRPSVRAQTVADIYSSGTESAKTVLDEKLESIFANDDVQVKDRSEVSKALETALEAEKDADVKQAYEDQYGPNNWDW